VSSDDLARTRASRGAEKAFREAFERLKAGKAGLLPRGSRVSQNNVAKEAGCTPSALRKERFPELVAEIQRYVDQKPDEASSTREKLDQAKSRNRTLAERQGALLRRQAYETSRVLSLLAEVAELRRQVLTLESRLNEGKIVTFRELK
jgi:chromatin segregation and condensation protein Rec8/ScpA/Scc1 (kleisin family)